MFYLNTTFVIDRCLMDDLLGWLKKVYVPAALATSVFTTVDLVQVLNNEEPDGISLACRLGCDSLSEATRWHETTATMLHEDLVRRWGAKVMYFSTYLKAVDL